MRDLILAIIIGIVITVATILVPLLVALLLPVATFGIIVLAAWFLIRLWKHDGSGNGDR